MNKYLSPCKYLPHDPPMVLIDKVISVDENKAITQCIVNNEGSLAPFLNAQGNLPSYFSLEIFAQTVGIWNGFNDKFNTSKRKIGMLLGARDLKVKEPFFKTGSILNIEVYKNIADSTLANFEGKIFLKQGNNSEVNKSNEIASGRITVIQLTECYQSKLFKFRKT